MCDECERLAQELEETQHELDQALDLLEAIAAFCRDVKDRAEPTLSRSSGVPRGQWSRLKGRIDVCDRILGAAS